MVRHTTLLTPPCQEQRPMMGIAVWQTINKETLMNAR